MKTLKLSKDDEEALFHLVAKAFLDAPRGSEEEDFYLNLLNRFASRDE